MQDTVGVDLRIGLFAQKFYGFLGIVSHVLDTDKRVMLRKDKPEVLMLSDRLAELYYDEEIN